MTGEPVDQTTVERRHLAVLLRELRTAADLSQTQLADRLGMSQSTVSKLETAQQPPTVATAEEWARVCGAAADQLAEVRASAEAAQAEVSNWRDELRSGLAAGQRRVQRIEQRASLLRTFMTAAVPALMQDAAYARRLFEFGAFTTPGQQRDVAAAVSARLDRQQVLYEPGKRIEIICTEAALRWRPLPKPAMAAQLHRVTALSTLPAVRFGVIPLEPEAEVVHLHGFNIIGDPDAGEDTLVIAETLTAPLYVRDPVYVGVYAEMFTRLMASALVGDDARGFVTRLAERLR